VTRFTPLWRQADSSRKSSSQSNPRQQWRGDRLLNLIYKTLLYAALPFVLAFLTMAVWASGAGKWEFHGCYEHCGKAASKRSCYACCRASRCNGVDRIRCMKACDDKWGLGDGDQ
jgi:hypothetical protein